MEHRKHRDYQESLRAVPEMAEMFTAIHAGSYRQEGGRFAHRKRMK